MLYGEEAEGRLGPWGFWGFWGFLEIHNSDSWNMLHIKFHEPKIFEARKIKYLIERI
jgi:hypothetical protein